MMAEDFWVGEPSYQGRRYWETTRKLVLAVSLADVLEIFRRVRRSVGWLSDHATSWLQQGRTALELLYLLVDIAVPADMKIWVLQRAATGDWEEPSQNY
jgi:hypothetical protein